MKRNVQYVLKEVRGKINMDRQTPKIVKKRMTRRHEGSISCALVERRRDQSADLPI